MTGRERNREKELRDACYEATMWIDVLCRDDAAWAVEVVLDRIIAVLRRDAGVPKRSTEEWTLVFADACSRAEDELTEVIDGCVDYRGVVTAIVEYFVEQEIDGGHRPLRVRSAQKNEQGTRP